MLPYRWTFFAKPNHEFGISRRLLVDAVPRPDRLFWTLPLLDFAVAELVLLLNQEALEFHLFGMDILLFV